MLFFPQTYPQAVVELFPALASVCMRMLRRLGARRTAPPSPLLPARRYSRVGGVLPSRPKDGTLATPNYSYEKRQRELAKKRKAEEKAAEKRLRKLQGRTDEAPGPEGVAPADHEPDPAPGQDG